MSTATELHTIAAALTTEPAGARVIPDVGPPLQLSGAEPAREGGRAVVLVSGKTDAGHPITLPLSPNQPVTIRTR